MESRSDKVFRFLGLLVNVELAIAAVLLTTWWTIVAFVGGRMPVIGFQTEGGLGVALVWLFVVDPLTFVAFRLAALLIGTCLSLLSAPIGRIEARTGPRRDMPGAPDDADGEDGATGTRNDDRADEDRVRNSAVAAALHQTPRLNLAQLSMATGLSQDQAREELDYLTQRGIVDEDGHDCYELSHTGQAFFAA
jgi:hypothetical protein